MGYHIDTGLIKDKFKENHFCPLCEIKKIVEEQYLYEFLNDAVMEDCTRAKVNKLGFCSRHFDMLFSRQNKLGLALQTSTRLDNIKDLFLKPKNYVSAKKLSDKIDKSQKTCIVCDYVNESMVKYYKTTAQLFLNEKTFRTEFLKSNGFCMEHYSMLLKYSKGAGFLIKEYLDALVSLQTKAFNDKKENLKYFCDKHDYRNRTKPLGNAENALPDIRDALYGKKHD